MNDIKTTVVLYSKYMDSSRLLKANLERLPSDYRDALRLSYLCVDNKKIRELVTSSKSINILYIPTVLMVMRDGQVRKYEGNDSFSWLGNIFGTLQSEEEQEQTQYDVSGANVVNADDPDDMSTNQQVMKEQLLRHDVLKSQIMNKPTEGIPMLSSDVQMSRGISNKSQSLMAIVQNMQKEREHTDIIIP